MELKKQVLNLGYVKLLNLSGPVRRPESIFDADDIDPAKTARISFDNFDKERSRELDIKLLKYLIKNKHSTPVEMIETWWEMKIPIFVARQLIRHRTATVNEVSLRYVEAEDEFWYPELKDIGHRPDNMKQGRVIDGSITVYHTDWIRKCRELDTQAYELYKQAIACGIPPEVARTRLPLATYTTWVWKQDIHNLMHFLRLRLDEHAQFESRQVAGGMFDLLSEHLPEIMSIFKETL